MAAPIGNKFWKMRDESGRKKLFENTPEALQNLLDMCNDYFAETDKRKWIKRDFIKSGNLAGQIVEIEVDTPYTFEGLCQHLEIDTKTFYNYRNSENYKDFFPIFAYVEDRIKKQHAEGAMISAFDSSFTARYDGIKDRSDITSNDKDIQGITSIIITREDYKALSRDIDKEI